MASSVFWVSQPSRQIAPYGSAGNTTRCLAFAEAGRFVFPSFDPRLYSRYTCLSRKTIDSAVDVNVPWGFSACHL